jgi:hypothetical protein
MKKLTCKQLGGACDEEIAGATFAEIGKKCREHVMAKIKAGDAAHKAAADKMSKATPEQQKKMMAEFENRFNSAPKA